MPKQKKFKNDNAVLDVVKNGEEPVSQINFVTEVCNHSGDKKLNVDLQPVFDQQKELLKKEAATATSQLFKSEVPDNYFQTLVNGKKFRGSSYSLIYVEEEPKCDTLGGLTAMFSLFPK